MNSDSSGELQPFLNPHAFRQLDIYFSRRAILKALKGELPRLSGTLLDVGCGRQPYKELVLSAPSQVTKYIGLDLKTEDADARYAADLYWDGHSIPLDDNSVDCAMATEVFEQCPEPGRVMGEIARVLKPGRPLFFTVPFLWPIHDPPFDQYRFTPFAIDRFLRSSGFQEIKIDAFGGWDSSLAQMIALWVRRRPMGRFYRRLLTLMMSPLVRCLASRDNLPVGPSQYNSTVMITGLSGTALKKIA